MVPLGTLVLGAFLGAGVTYLATGNRDPGHADNQERGRVPKSTRSVRNTDKKGSGQSAASLSPEDAARELGDLLGRVESEADFNRLRDLVSRAAEWSPESTLELANSIEDPYRRRDALRRLFNYWIGSDQQAALEAIHGMENVALRRDLYREAMRWLAGDDPLAAINLLKTEANFRDRELWTRAFVRLARTDRDEAVKGILALKDPGLREDALKSVAGWLADTDLPKALEWAATLDEEQQQTALAGVLEQAAHANPGTVVAHLEKIPEGRVRNQIIARTADEWAERDPEAAMEWAESLGEDERILAVGEIAETVFETDPDRAEDIVDLIPGTEARREVLGQIARLRATVDVREAVEWVATLPDEDRGGAWAGVAREWASIDPQGAADYVAGADDPVAYKQLVSALSSSWSQRDPAGAAEWARTLDDERAQRDAMYRIVETWSREDPAAAGEFVSSSLDGELQTHMTRQVVSRWLRNDTAEASVWIDNLPDGRARDMAVYTLVGSIEGEFPDTALQWANTISDPKKRKYMQQRLEKRLGK